jgi:hypothetical protein
MKTPKQKPKDLIPKKAQIALLVIGIPLLLFTVVRFAGQMGWIGGPPKAKRVVQKKDDQKPKPDGDAAPTGKTPAPKPVRVGGKRREQPDLDSIELPARDPLGDLRLAQQPTPPEPATPGQPTPPGAASAAASGPPPLPPPMPAPPSAPGFPSPVAGARAALPPAMVAAQPIERGLPPALSASYPVLRRGGRVAQAPPVSLVGTISGPQGSIAVVRSAEGGAPGRYVRPGQLTLGGRGRTHELSLPSPATGTRESGGSAAGGTTNTGPVPSGSVAPAGTAPEQ